MKPSLTSSKSSPRAGQTDRNSLEPGFDLLASFNKASGDPLRLEVLRVLKNNSWGVLELCHILDVKQSALSHHLKILAQADLVCTRREGNSIFYRRNDRSGEDPLCELQKTLFENIDQHPLKKTISARIKHAQKDRTARSKEFFRQQAESFEQQQERIATPAIYTKGVVELLHNSGLPNFQNALEVGPGNGDFLITLAETFNKVVALDNSEEMLGRAKKQCKELKLNNIQFVYGDTDTAVQTGKVFDCIVLNMVLHHTPSPAELFDDLFTLLDTDGVLLITEICQHQQEWVKEACGDLWLGFEPDDIIEWANSAGFCSNQSVYQALRNGFQIQLHCFAKKHLHKLSNY